MNSDFNILEKKLDAFRRKYLLYQFIRGGLIVGALFILFFVTVNLLEYNLFMSQVWRKILFFSTLLFFGLLTMRYVFFPAAQLIGLVRILNNRKLNGIITRYVPGVKDKLINVLELHDQRDSLYSESLTGAAISQKISELKLVDFGSAISLKNLKNLFFYFVASFAVVTILFMADRSLLTVPGNRILHFNQEFVKPAPYMFILGNDKLEVEKGSDFRVEVECRGKEIPSVLYIHIGGRDFVMKSMGEGRFAYDFSAVVRPVDFHFTDLKHHSAGYLLDVIALPVINSFGVSIVPPGYTGMEGTRFENVGDLKVPAGSILTWNFDCFDTDSLSMERSDSTVLIAEKKGKNLFSVSGVVNQPDHYRVVVFNPKTGPKTAMSFSLQIIPDYFPEIKVVQIADSIQLTRFYFRGNIHDDYGFAKLHFHLVSDDRDTLFPLPVVPYMTDQEFYYTFDFRDFAFLGSSVSYFFSVSDNDGVNGPKTTTSDSFSFTFPDRNEIKKNQEEKYEEIEKLMSQSSQMAAELQSNIRELQLKNLNGNISDWEKSRLVEEIVREKNQLEEILERIEKLNSEQNSYRNTFTEQQQDILKKQQQLEELLDTVMTEELRKLMEEFSKLAEEFDSKQLNELSRKMEMSFEDLSEQLDRNLEMLKKMQIEQKLEDLITRVEELRDRTLEESGEIEKGEDTGKMAEKAREAIHELNDLEQELQSVLLENKEMEKPVNFDDFREDFEEIREDLEKAGDELQKGSRRKGAENQRKASEKMGNMAFAMRQMLEASDSGQNAENMRDLRQILKNLVFLSFSQEDILEKVRSTASGDPAYRMLSRQQQNLSEQSQVIRDSLYALARRAPELGNVVNNEILALEFNLVRSGELMGEGLYSQASANQQLVITAANNLALFLSDVLQSMEDQMSDAQGDSDNSSQGGKPGKMGGLQKQSENLRKQLQQMIEEMKSGMGGKMSRQMGESLMMHEMMQQMLRELMNGGTLGGDARKQLQTIDQLLEQNRRDIMNKRIQPDLLRRHHDIMTRLLEAEKSEMERDQDNKRESHTADDQFYSNPALIFEKNSEKNITIEHIQRNSLKMNSFFQDKYKNYVEKFNSHAKE